jgi:hypothetical protein
MIADFTTPPTERVRAMPTSEHLPTPCPVFDAMCGLRIQVDGGCVARIRPNHDDVWGIPVWFQPLLAPNAEAMRNQLAGPPPALLH